MKGLSIRESFEIRCHAQIKLNRFTQANGESLSQAWGRFVEIISVFQGYHHSDSQLYRYFTTNLHGSTIEFLKRMHVSKFEDLQWAATLDDVLDEARSTGSLTFAADDTSDRDFLEFVFANVSEAGDIDGVYVSREGGLFHLRTFTTPEIETLELPTEDEYLGTLGSIVDVVQSTGELSMTADDASERKLHDYIMRNISDAGTIDDGVYARVEGDTIHFYTVSTAESCEGNDDTVCDVVPEPSLLPDLSPQLEPVEYMEPTIEELVEEMLADSYVNDYEALLGEDQQSADVPLQFLGEEFQLVMETCDAHAQEFHQSFFSRHRQVQLMIDHLKTMSDKLEDTPITEFRTFEPEGDYFQMPDKPEENNLEIVETMHEDKDEISEKFHQQHLNLIIHVDDPLWETFISGEKSSHQVFAACFSQLISGPLRGMLEAALLGLDCVCGAVHLAEPRKVQIEQLDAPLKIPDPPFLRVSLIQ